MSIEVLSVRGLRPKCGKVDRDLWLWFLEAKKDYKNYHGPRVTKRMVQNKAMQAFKDAGITGFKASDGWYVRWIKRWHRFGCETGDKNHVSRKEDKSNILSHKKKPIKRSSKKSEQKTHLPSDLRNSGHSDCLPTQEPGLFPASSSGYPIDKLQILHDVASRELADSVFQEMSIAETRSHSYEQTSHVISTISPAEHSDNNTTPLLDFDQIAWNDVPYADKPDLSNNPNTLYRIDENSLNYSSSVMSQMMEFAEICHLKEKEMQQHHIVIQDRDPSKQPQQAEEQRICDYLNIIQPQNAFHSSETKTFANISCSNSDEPFSCTASDFLPDNPFYCMDDSSFQILDNSNSAFSSNNTSSKGAHNVPKDDVSVLLSAAYSNHVMKVNDHIKRKEAVSSDSNVSAVLEAKYLLNDGKDNPSDKSPSCSKTIDILTTDHYKSDNLSIIGLGSANSVDSEHMCCSDQGSISVLFGTSHQPDQLNIVGLNSLNFGEGPDPSSSREHSVDFMYEHNHQSIEMGINYNGFSQEISGNHTDSREENSISICDDINQSDVGISNLIGHRVCGKGDACSLSDTCMNVINVNENYYPNHVNIIELNSVNVTTPTVASNCKRNNVGVVYNGEYSTNHVNVIELDHANPVSADLLCSMDGESIVFNGHSNINRMNIVELDSFNIDEVENLEDRVVLRTDFHASEVSIIELNTASLGAVTGHSLTSNESQSLMPRAAESGLGTAVSEASLSLFNESPFSFTDDEMSDVLPLPSANSAGSPATPVSPPDILALSKDGADSDLDLVNSVILDEVVRMEDQQNEFSMVNAQSSDKATSTKEDTNCESVVSTKHDRPPPPHRRLGGERYLPCFKRKVLEYAAQHTAKDAAKQFHVHADTVTLWSRSKEVKNPVSPLLPDQQMLSWLKQKRESGTLLTRNQVSNQAKELLQTPGPWQKNKSRWFYVWGSRFADVEIADGKNVESGRTKESSSLVPSSFSKALYPDEFKVEVAMFAERTSQNLASSVFNIARKRVFEWVGALKGTKKAEEEPHKVHEEKLTLDHAHRSENKAVRKVTDVAHQGPKGKGLGRALTSVAVDQELWKWFCEQTAKKNKPKSREIRSKAVELFRAHKYERIRCSHGWFKKWSIRHGIALRYEGDSELLVWCLEQFDHNRNISHRDLLNQAYLILSGTHKSDFKASAGWALRFCKRHRSLLSTRPSFEMDLPDELEDRVTDFRSKTQQLIHSLGALSKNIGSMDEIPLNLTAGGSGTSRTRLLLRRSGFENCHATVVLCCLSDGTLLPPAVIFKGQGSPEWKSIDGVRVLMLHQEESCMTPSAMVLWLQCIWFKNVTSPSILFLDCFEPHWAKSVVELSAEKKCHLKAIPAGCSSKLQPLEMSVTRQFEDMIADRWAKHYASLDHFSSVKRATYSSNGDVIRWVAEAYAKLQLLKKDDIQYSFVTMGLNTNQNQSVDNNLDHSLCSSES